MKTYPVNLVLNDRLVVLVGAGNEISRKIAGLLEVNARIRVIAPEAHPIIQNATQAGQLEWLQRKFQPGDLTGAFMIITATGDPKVNDAVWIESQQNGQLCNVMDVIPQCNFYAASVVRQGLLTLAIGTGGAAPALAATLRKRFEKGFGPEYAEFLEYAQSIRPIVAARIPTFKLRAEFWYELIEGNAVVLLRAGQRALFEAKVEVLLAHYEAEGKKEIVLV